MLVDFHRHPKSDKHTRPWVALPVFHLGDLDLGFFSYIRVQNDVISAILVSNIL